MTWGQFRMEALDANGMTRPGVARGAATPD